MDDAAAVYRLSSKAGEEELRICGQRSAVEGVWGGTSLVLYLDTLICCRGPLACVHLLERAAPHPRNPHLYTAALRAPLCAHA
jgi:hypothetical protein